MKSSKKFTLSYITKLPLPVLILLAVFTGALLLFVFILHEVLWDKEEALDHTIFAFLSAHVINTKLTGLMENVTYFASATFMQIGYGALVLLFLLLKNWKRAIEILIIGLGGFFINYIMKLTFHRLRPPNPLIKPLQNFSFPSGHATSGFIFYGLLVYLIWKTSIQKGYKITIGTLLILFALLIGFSRVYLRVHYPSDVLAGFCIGAAWILLAIWLMEWLKKKSDVEGTQKAL